MHIEQMTLLAAITFLKDKFSLKKVVKALRSKQGYLLFEQRIINQGYHSLLKPKKPITCEIEAATSGIAIRVKKYPIDMQVFFEYYEGKLQVHIWGEKALNSDGNPDATIVITENFDEFCKKIKAKQYN